MPFSHIGLTVSHLPQSCSFFLSALQPLGYRYIGEQGNQIGFGIDDADFFLSPELTGIQPTTAHIAFSAPSRAAVRDFYASALNAGGYPNGPPASRGEDGSLFNAAVTDLDGNSIEVIYHEDGTDQDVEYRRSHVLTWQRRIDDPEAFDDARSALSGRSSKSSLLSSASSAITSASRAKVPTVASSVSEASSAAAATPSEEKKSSGITTQGVIGTILGAAAGAAVAYAMVRSEQDSAREEAAFEAVMNKKPSAASAAPSVAKSVKSTRSKKSHRNYSTTESQVPESVRGRNLSVIESEFYEPPRKAKTQLTLEPAPEPVRFDQVSLSGSQGPRYRSLAPSRAATEYIPASTAPSKALSRAASQADVEYIPASLVSRRPSLASRRTRTAPPTVIRDDPLPESHQIEDAPSSQARRTERDWADEDLIVARRDSAMSDVSVKSNRSKHSSQSHVSKADSRLSLRSRRSEHRESSQDRSSRISRKHRDGSRTRSVISREPSMDRASHVSRRSRRSRHSTREREESSDRESEASTSTVKPSRSTHSSAADLPLPASRKTSVVSAADVPLPQSRKASVMSVVSAEEQPPPVSRKTSVVSAAELPLPASRRTSYFSAAERPLPPSRKTSVMSAMDVPLPGSRKTSVASGMEVPLPASRKTSVVSGMDVLLPTSRKTSIVSAMDMPLPESRTGSVSQSKAGSIIGSILGRDHHREDQKLSEANVPLPESHAGTSLVDSLLGRSAPESRIDYAETVLPDDSISCVASRRHKERNPSRSRSRSRSRESRRHRDRSKESRRRDRSKESRSHTSRHTRDRSRESKKSSASSSKRHRHRRDEEDLPPLPASEVGSSTSTITPGKSRKDSAVSLPVVSSKSRSGIERDEKKGKKSFMSAVMGH